MDSKDFLFELLRTPSPSGFEQPAQRLVRARMKPFAELLETDSHGNVIAGINTSAKVKVMLCGHCDQIGFMVRHISAEGFLSVSVIGGVDLGMLFGRPVVVHSSRGPVQGVFTRKAIHLQGSEERDRTKHDIDRVWIDIGAGSRREAERFVEIGDPATFDLSIVELKNQMIAAPGLDDKAGLFVAMETLRRCSKLKLNVGVYAVSSVQEELGLRGAITASYRIQPDIGIAIDVTHGTDDPCHDAARAVPCKLGAGPTLSRGPSTNPVVGELLESAAKSAKKPFQRMPTSRLPGNDASSMQISRAGIATAWMGIPNRYMHTPVEVCSLRDIQSGIDILVSFIKRLPVKPDLRPL
jgi:tetrahedral aminopeptidase